jgi:iron(III) transport system permease protein
MFNSFFILIFSYVVRFIAISYNSINSGFKKISININEVSRSLGINFFKTLFFIEIPLIKHSIIGGFILVFIDILKELPLTLILRPFNFETLSTKTFNLVSNEMIAESSSYALIIIIISLFFFFFLNSLTKNSKSCENTKD